MKIGIATDHHGIKTKGKIIKYLTKLGYEVIDFGPNREEATDYPLYAFKIGNAIKNNDIELGILMCGTGIGMSIAANKVKGIRCARIASNEDARLCREHNNANVIAFSANIAFYKIKKMLKIYLTTQVSQEERHIRRVNMIDEYHD